MKYHTPAIRVAASVVAASALFLVPVARVLAVPAPSVSAVARVASASARSSDVVDGVLYVSLSSPSGLGFVNGATVAAYRVTDGTKLWSRFILGGQGALVVTGGKVYLGWSFGGSGGLIALSAATGAVEYRTSHAKTRFATGPAAGNGMIYMNFTHPPTSSDFPGTCALRQSNGSVAWCHQQTSGGFHAAPVLYGNSLYVAGLDRLQALNAFNGHVVWTQFLTPNTRPVLVEGADLLVAGIYGQAYQVISLSPSTGAVLWNKPFGQAYVTPVESGGTAYFSAFDSTVSAFDAASGSQVWTVNTGDDFGPELLASGGHIFTGARAAGGNNVQYNTVRELSAATGEQVWASSSPGTGGAGVLGIDGGIAVTSENQPDAIAGINVDSGARTWVAPTDRNVDGAAAVNGSTLYAGADDGRIYALDASTGVSQFHASLDFPISFAPAVSNPYVFAVTGSPDNRLYAYSDAASVQLWANSFSGDIIDTPPVTTAADVVVASNEGKAYAFDQATGNPRWSTTISNSPGVNGMLATGNNLVYVSWQRDACGCQAGWVTALNATTGAKVWTTQVGGGGDPLSVAGTSLFVAAGGYIRDLNGITGKVFWQHKIKDYAADSITATGATVYAGAAKTGRLYALSASTGNQRWVHKLGGSIRSIALDGSTVFAGANHATAVSAANGHVMWTSVMSDGTQMAVSNGALFVSAVGPRYGGIYRLDEATGHNFWSYLTAQFPD